MGSVTNNSMWIPIGYRIYSFWRFTATTQITIMMNTLAFEASWILLSELHCTDVSLRQHTDEDWLTPKADRRRLTLSIVFHSLTLPATMETLALLLFVTM
jgi:hypothetical protein